MFITIITVAEGKMPVPRGRRSGPLIAAASLLIVGLVAGPRAGAGVVRAQDPRPNVLLIVADDMRADSLAAMPAVLRLAEHGITFNRAYVTTPLCCPSRATLLTGLYAHHHGVISNEPPEGGFERFEDRSTLATWLHAAGVRTGLIGRYLNHYQSLYIPPGWDTWFAIWQGSEDNGLYYHYYVNDAGEDAYYGQSSERYSTRVVAREALRFLADEPDRPFFLYLAPRAPHGPATPDVHDAGTLKGSDLGPWPPSFDEADVSDKPSFIRAGAPLTDDEQQDLADFRRRQYETLLGLDRAVEALVEQLRQDGRLDSTWIVFTADNGLMLGEHRLGRGKGRPYEESVRVPLVIVPPGGLTQARRDDHLVANVDLAPTIAALLGAEPAAPVDGLELSPLLRDPAAPWRGALPLEMSSLDDPTDSWSAVLTADRKYVRYANGEEELYDEARDPYELDNLSADFARSAEKAALADLLGALLAAPPARPAR